MRDNRQSAQRASSVGVAAGGPTARMVWGSLLAAISLGCQVSPWLPVENDVEVLLGKDSAGAVIEIEKQGGDLTRARVSDLVLGTAEAEITQAEGHLSFTIRFPAGVAITYTATLSDTAHASASAGIEGTWMQHANGVFGQDTGTWGVERQVASGL